MSESSACDEVAAHYNGLRTCGFDARRASPIFTLRNFNNWVKSTVIRDATAAAGITDGGGSALDLCCGRGGDLFKWRAARVARLVCVDVAAESVSECERKFRNLRGEGPRPDAAFLSRDCFDPDAPLAGAHPLLRRPFDVVSCQFALHYSFETLPRARAMLRNVADALRPGGVFVGTLPDSLEIVRRIRAERKAGRDGAFGNSAYRIAPRFNPDVSPPLFGSKYDFHLEGAVDCPEFLVHFPALADLAAEFGLRLVRQTNFADFFAENRDSNYDLLRKMESLESVGRRDAERKGYRHAADHFASCPAAETIGTMSQEEWEAATIYCTFSFEKTSVPRPSLRAEPAPEQLRHQRKRPPSAESASPQKKDRPSGESKERESKDRRKNEIEDRRDAERTDLEQTF